MSARTFTGFWHDDRVNSVAVYLKKNGSAEQLSAAFRAAFSQKGEFVIYSNQSLRRRIFEIFDQTFVVTYVLLAIAVVVAVTGIFLSLTTLITERSRELAVFRAIGGSAAQIRQLVLWETGMIGALAAGYLNWPERAHTIGAFLGESPSYASSFSMMIFINISIRSSW